MTYSSNKGIVELQVARTLEQFGVDPKDLGVTSHKKVCVKCTRCEKEFVRKFRHILQLHNCSSTIVNSNGAKLKWCNKCKAYRTYDSFTTDNSTSDKLMYCCSDCYSDSSYSSNKNKFSAARVRNNLVCWMKISICKKRIYCNKHGIAFDLELDYLEQQWKKQNGKCFYFNIDLTFANKGLDSAHMERLDRSKGYVKENVVLASKIANYAKNDTSQSDFLKIIQNIINNIDGSMGLKMEKQL